MNRSIEVLASRRASERSEVTGPLRSSFTGSIVVQLANVATGLVLARTLGPHDRGVLAAVMIWPGLVAMLAGLGVADAIAYSVARKRERLGVVTGTALAIGLAQAAAACLVAVAVILVVLDDLSAGDRSAAFLYLALVPLNILGLYLMAVLNGLQRFVSFQVIRASGVFVTLACLAGLAAAGTVSVHTAVATYITANVVALVLAGVRLRMVVREPLAISMQTSRRLLGYGLRSHVGSVAGFLNTRLDQLAISVALAPAKLGLYAVSVTLTSVTTLVGASVANVGLPALAHISDEGRRRRAARDLVALTFLISVAVSIPLVIFMPALVALLFGPSWSGAVGPARVLLLGAVLLSTSQALGAALRALGRPLNAAYAELVAVPVAAIGLAFLLPIAGLVGAGLASALAYGVSAGWMARRAAFVLGLRQREFLPTLVDLRSLAGLLGRREPASPEFPEAAS